MCLVSGNQQPPCGCALAPELGGGTVPLSTEAATVRGNSRVPPPPPAYDRFTATIGAMEELHRRPQACRGWGMSSLGASSRSALLASPAATGARDDSHRRRSILELGPLALGCRPSLLVARDSPQSQALPDRFAKRPRSVGRPGSRIAFWCRQLL